MADTVDSKSTAAMCAGSSPAIGTKNQWWIELLRKGSVLFLCQVKYSSVFAVTRQACAIVGLSFISAFLWSIASPKSLLPDKNNNNDEQKGIMFKYIVAMAQEMGLECIAEGVETKEHVDLLTSNSCKLAQGYYFDKPLPVEEFETRLDANYIYDI